MALPRRGTAGRPLKETDAMSNALTDIGNGGLEPAPVADGADPEYFPAIPTTIPAQPDSLGTFVEPGEGEPVAPQTPPALRAHFHLGPLILTPELKETLDGNVQGKYQGSVLCEFYSLCSGVKGDAALFTPFSPQSDPAASSHRYNLTSSQFQSRHRERFRRLCVRIVCKTTGGEKEKYGGYKEGD